MNNLHSLLIVLVTAGVTILLRFLPFLVFTNKTPKAIVYLGKVLPCAIMAMLVVFCLKNVNVLTYPFALPEFISILAVIILHKWRHNTLISIPVGTVLYMILIRLF